tara:strand:+ start:347 stop:1006 length:660 start_codon:yes stop_codon:yes gene_type:complete
MFRNQKILITGANGKIGTAICDVLEKNEGYDIIKFTHGNDLLEKNDNEYKGNLFISDHIKHVFNDHDIDIVIHLAVSRNPMSNPRIRSYETFEKDTIILFNLLSCCDNISKFIFSSSAAVYGHAYFKDVVSRKDVAQKIYQSITTDEYDNKFINVHEFDHDWTSLKTDPFDHLKANSADGKDDNRMINGLSKLTNEMIIKLFAFERNINYTNLRIHRVF